MTEVMHSQKSDCRNCYKCIRHCPVKSIRFVDNQAHIIQNECILCGQCYVVCPQGAKVIRPDLDRAKELIAGGAPVYALRHRLSPPIRAPAAPRWRLR